MCQVKSNCIAGYFWGLYILWISRGQSQFSKIKFKGGIFTELRGVKLVFVKKIVRPFVKYRCLENNQLTVDWGHPAPDKMSSTECQVSTMKAYAYRKHLLHQLQLEKWRQTLGVTQTSEMMSSSEQSNQGSKLADHRTTSGNRRRVQDGHRVTIHSTMRN